jgi:hypothetical protein
VSAFGHWNDDGSVTSGGPVGTATITNDSTGWITTQVYANTGTSPTRVEYDYGDYGYAEIWENAAIIDSAPVCLRRPPEGFAYTKVTWTFIEKTCRVVDLITGNPRQTRAPPRVMVA